MALLIHEKRLEEFFDIVDPQRKPRARELLLSLASEEDLFNLLEEEYGDYYRRQHKSANPTADPILPMCKYGKECYRKNPSHFKEFSH